ncbi:MAG: hypothetical protein GXO99_02595, partial [Nitrospirae bacterium]|nr:hypothetical protein [Nitrospirota bacterium]
ISPAKLDVIRIDSMTREALNIKSPCDCDVKKLLLTLQDIYQLKQKYISENMELYNKLLEYQNSLLKKAEKEARKEGVSIINTISGQTLSVLTAVTFDFVDEAGEFLLKEFSEAGAVMTLGRGIVRNTKAAKATIKTIGTAQNLSKLMDSKLQKYASYNLPPLYRQFVKKMATNLDNLLTLRLLEANLWAGVLNSPDCFEKIKSLCRKEGLKDAFEYKQNTLKKLYSQFAIDYLEPSYTEEKANDLWGFKALGFDLGFSMEKDDPLSIGNYVIPTIRQFESLKLEIEKLLSASATISGKLTNKKARSCQLCLQLLQLKMSYDLENEINRTEAEIKQTMIDLQKNILGSYKDIKRLWKRSSHARTIDQTLARPAYVLSTTAISFFVPWAGTTISLTEAGYKILIDAIDVMVKSEVDQEIKNNIKKFNLFLTELAGPSVIGKLTYAHERLLKAQIEATRAIKACKQEGCDEKRFYPEMPASHTVKAIYYNAVDGLQGCWTFNNIYPLGVMSLYIKKTPAGYRVWFVKNRQQIPMKVRFQDGLMVLTHTFSEETLRAYLQRTPTEEEIRDLVGSATLKIKLRPYASRSGIISALAVRMNDNFKELQSSDNAPAFMPTLNLDLRAATTPLVQLTGQVGIGRHALIKVLDAETGKELSTIPYGKAVILQYSIASERNCPVEKDTLYVKLSPEKDPTLAKWVALTETEETSGVLKSPPIYVDFYQPGNEKDRLSLLPQDASVGPGGYKNIDTGSFGAMVTAFGGRMITISGVGKIRPIKPATEEALRYALASQILLLEEIREAATYAQLDPLFGREKRPPGATVEPSTNTSGPPFSPPQINIPQINMPGMNSPVRAYPSPYKQNTAGKSIIDPEALKNVPVKVPVNLNSQYIDPNWYYLNSSLKRIESKYNQLKELTQKPQWADPRIRRLWLLEAGYKEQKAYYQSLKNSLKTMNPQTKAQVQGIVTFTENSLRTTEAMIKKLKASLKKEPPHLYKKPITRKLLFTGYKIAILSDGTPPSLSVIKRFFYSVGEGYELIETEHPVSRIKTADGTIIWNVNLEKGREISRLMATDKRKARYLRNLYEQEQSSFVTDPDRILRKIQIIFGPKAKPLNY